MEPIILPNARKDELIVQTLEDETLVYDSKRHRAFCLNRTATLVWDRCDGETSMDQMVSTLNEELGVPANEDMVWLALKQLGTAHLIGETLEAPEALKANGYSRRDILKQMGMVGVAVLLPTVITMAAPRAAQAATCVQGNACAGLPQGTPCGPPQCTKICCGATPETRVCRQPSHADCA